MDNHSLGHVVIGAVRCPVYLGDDGRQYVILGGRPRYQIWLWESDDGWSWTMTEAQWQAITELPRLFEHLERRATARRWRLSAFASARSVNRLITNGWVLEGLDVAERYADGRASESEANAHRNA